MIKDHEELMEHISQSVTRMTSMVDLTKSQYPYLPLTFSVWRKQKYQEFKQHSRPGDDLDVVQFHHLIDKQLLPLFLGKTKEGIRESFKELRVPSSNKLREFRQDPYYQCLITQYIEATTGQLYRLEILADMLTWPYGIRIDQSYYLRRQFADYQQNSSHSGVMSNLINAHGKTVVSKGLSAIGGQMWGRIAMGIVGGFNILGLAGGVLIGKMVDIAFSKMNTNNRLHALQKQIVKFNSNSETLQECIRACTQALDKYITSTCPQQKSKLRSSFQSIIQRVFVLQSEQMQTTLVISQLEEGWKLIGLKQSDEQFELLEDTESEQPPE